MSQQDRELMSDIGDFNIYSYIIAEKIISNAEMILNNSKESRFGNLFVGLNKINDEYNLKY